MSKICKQLLQFNNQKTNKSPPTTKNGQNIRIDTSHGHLRSVDVCFNCLPSILRLLVLAPGFLSQPSLSCSVHVVGWNSLPLLALREAIRAPCSCNARSAQRWAHDPVRARERRFQHFLEHLGETAFHPTGPELGSYSLRAAGNQLAMLQGEPA